MKRQNNNTKTNKLASCSKAWLLLSVLFLMPVISQAGNWQLGNTSLSTTYNIYSTGSGYKFTVTGGNENGSTVYDGMGWLSVQGGATVNIVFHTTAPVGLAGGLKVDYGTLNLSLANDYNVPDGQATIVRWTTQSLLHVCNATATISNAKMTVTGRSDKHFIFDGQANITYSGSNAAGWTASNSGTNAKDPIMLVQAGQAILNYVDLRNN